MHEVHWSAPASAEDYVKAFDTLEFLTGVVESYALGMQARAQAVPVVIVGGFLGAGKTTLLRALLSGDHGLRLTAIVNDVASLDIDAALVATVSDDTLALTNGCVCCSQSGGAARALVDVSTRNPTPDLVLLETSGVAAPGTLAQALDSLSGVVVDTVVTVVDAASEHRSPTVRYLLERQVAAADLILVNKTDLVSEAVARSVAASAFRLAPGAEVLCTSHCAVPAALVLQAARGGSRSLDSAPAHESSDHDFCTVALEARAAIDRRALAERIAQLPDGVLRGKGLLEFTDTPGRYELLQLVGRRWRFEPAAGATVDSARLLFIALADRVDPAALAAHFAPLGLERATPG